MALTAQNIIDRARNIIQDNTSVRWLDAELLEYLNDAQRQIVLQVPNSFAVNEALVLAADSKQSVPAGGIKILDVIRNVGGRGITLIERTILDSIVPDWHEESGDEVKHWVYNPDNPKNFYVYPNVSGSVEIVYSKSPTDVAAVGNAITLDDIYANAILDYMLYRAYSKDVEYAGNSGRAAAAYAAFNAQLGNKLQIDQVADPNVDAPPRPRNTR